MLKKPKTRILAIDPGTRYLGYAVLDGHSILYHGVKVLPATKDASKACSAAIKAVAEVINHLHPTVLALEHSFHGPSKRLARQVRLVGQLRRLGRKHQLQTVCYAPTTVRKYLCGSGWANKRDVAQMVVWHYPEMRPYIVRESQWKERFHCHMFDAVAVGLYALSRL